MKKNGMGKRLLLFALTAAIVLTMQETPVFAGPLLPQEQPETPSGQSERQSVSQNNLSDGESVSQNDLSNRGSVSQNDLSELSLENQLTAEQSGIELLANPSPLTENILNKCKVPGLNPEGAVVNLFDYWQGDDKDDPTKEVAHDYEDGSVTTYNLGISKDHLLRFGYRDNNCAWCKINTTGDYGAWNQYIQLYPYDPNKPDDPDDKGQPYKGIVKNELGPDGFPVLNLSNINSAGFGLYNSVSGKYLDNKEESLAYLFSPSVSNDYKAIRRNVKGLFQLNSNGYYYYRSTENFASYDEPTNSFILYNSPGVAKLDDTSQKAVFCGQFFPFNKATEVFDSYYNVNGKCRLIYEGTNATGDDTPIVDGNNNSYIRCIAPRLNHYLGMTLEVPFLQPVNGCLSNGTPMTFSFSGDDDVWIFIDDVLVADLGGIHDAYSLKIDFNSGNVYIQRADAQGNKLDHTLLKSFQNAYGSNSNLGGVAFNGATFANNTVHTLKMFYLERGYMASDLSLEFNIQPVRYEPVEEEDTIEDEEFEPDSEQENIPETEQRILSVSDNMMLDSVGTPQTGDDSMIWWWAVLCIASLLGIGAVVCNLIFVKKKQAAESSKGKEEQYSTKSKQKKHSSKK